MTVVDASAAVELLLRTEVGERVEGRLFGHGESLHAPHLLDVEVAGALRKLVHRGEITRRRAGEAIEDLALVGLVRHPHLDLLPRVWALRENLTPYDAVYVMLAESLAAPLVTCDGALAASPGHRARIECLR